MSAAKIMELIQQEPESEVEALHVLFEEWRSTRQSAAGTESVKEWTEADEEAWDRQIEADALAGKLDQLWAKAEADIKAGNVMPLDEFLRNH